MITANDVKTKGIACFEQILMKQPEAVITVRGQERFIVMKIEQYHYLREMELEAALHGVKQDVMLGKTVTSTINEHVSEVFE